MVPVAGVALLAVPVFQLTVEMIADVVPVDGIRLENDTLVIEGPRFEGRTSEGSNYTMTAARAESRVGDLNTSDLYDLVIDLRGGGTYTAQVEFSTAAWTMSTQYLTSNEDVFVSDSTGASGILAGVEVDWPEQVISSDGPVRFSFESGAELVSDTMVHDLNAANWTFGGVSLDMVPTQDTGADRDPNAVEPPDAP